MVSHYTTLVLSLELHIGPACEAGLSMACEGSMCHTIGKRKKRPFVNGSETSPTKSNMADSGHTEFCCIKLGTKMQQDHAEIHTYHKTEPEVNSSGTNVNHCQRLYDVFEPHLVHSSRNKHHGFQSTCTQECQWWLQLLVYNCSLLFFAIRLMMDAVISSTVLIWWFTARFVFVSSRSVHRCKIKTCTATGYKQEFIYEIYICAMCKHTEQSHPVTTTKCYGKNGQYMPLVHAEPPPDKMITAASFKHGQWITRIIS